MIRRDLKMSRGKEIAQAAHASLGVVLNNLEDLRVKEWLASSFRKVALVVDTEEELLELYNKGKERGVLSVLITDNGATYFNGVPTRTVVALGPDYDEKLDEITGHLRLR